MSLVSKIKINFTKRQLNFIENSENAFKGFHLTHLRVHTISAINKLRLQ